MYFKTKLIALAMLLCGAAAFCQSAKISPNDWNVFSENNKKVTLKDTVFQGKPCIKLDGSNTAIAIRNGSQYKSFRVDVDIAGRVMSGIGFHAADPQNYQFLYFRPGYGGTQEAIQYMPIYNGALSWVLYNYPTYETTADIKSLEWFHAAIEVRGPILRVFVNYSPNPGHADQPDRNRIQRWTDPSEKYVRRLLLRKLLYHGIAGTFNGMENLRTISEKGNAGTGSIEQVVNLDYCNARCGQRRQHCQIHQ
jgi:hypothetical protein